MSCKEELIEFHNIIRIAINNSENVENRLPNLGGGFVKVTHYIRVFISELRNLSFKVSNDLKSVYNYNESFNINELVKELKKDVNNKIKVQNINNHLIKVIDSDVEVIKNLNLRLSFYCDTQYNLNKLIMIWDKIVDDILDDESKL